MSTLPSYHVVLFNSVNQTMWADKLLKEKRLPHKLIPVPRQISSDCGVCIRIESGFVNAAHQALAGVEGFTEIMQL